MRRDFEAAVTDAILTVRAEASAIRFMVSAMRVRDFLERRYRSDQPRAPRGTHEGGQWVDDPGTQRVAAEFTAFGTLLKEYRYGQNAILCIYDFGGQTWTLTYEKDGPAGCYKLIHQSQVLGRGTRLNDN
jgi:hypothetical protein